MNERNFENLLKVSKPFDLKIMVEISGIPHNIYMPLITIICANWIWYKGQMENTY